MASSLVLNRSPKVPAEDTAAFGAIAERFRRAGALEKAVSLCREGLRKFPGHVSAQATLGWSLLDLGQYEEARTELEQVLRRAPDNLAAIRGLAELHDRFEHTLNLPMDGPGQWPPSADEVESLGEIAAQQSQLLVAEDEGIEELAQPSPVATSVVAVSADHTGVSQTDLEALIAEANSLEAAAEASVAETLPMQMESDMAPALDVVIDLDLDLDPELDLAALMGVEPDADLPLTVQFAAPAASPDVAYGSLEQASAPELEDLPVALEALPESPPVEAQPAESRVLQFAAAVSEPVVAEPPAADAVVYQIADVDGVEEPGIAAQAHVADVVAIERGAPAAARSPLPDLERLLVSVHARRQQLMTESVA